VFVPVPYAPSLGGEKERKGGKRGKKLQKRGGKGGSLHMCGMGILQCCYCRLSSSVPRVGLLEGGKKKREKRGGDKGTAQSRYCFSTSSTSTQADKGRRKKKKFRGGKRKGKKREEPDMGGGSNFLVHLLHS